MNDYYILMLIALGSLAILDLVVGVSNDAVNFLNSAIGSKAIPFKTILIIASFGIFLGASTSSGMMEVARKGIFVPGEFYFNDIMYIFMAVMITDIILLDIFNNLGLPTSTTVSLVFELLGAAVVMALLKIATNDTETIENLGKYINSEKALEIILGIFLSIFIAFFVGALVMFISRTIYSFHYEKKKKYVHAIFAGIAVTIISHFIILDGLKGTPFFHGIKEFIIQNELIFIISSFVFWTLAGIIITRFTKLNILTFIIGLGTFSLALAFAGNDLVNFIGAPIAALNSYQEWKISGVAANEFKMGVLAQKVPTQTGLLFLAGFIMVLTLWFSKKAKHVTDTEIGLASQSEGNEKFLPNDFSRIIVRGASFINQQYVKIVPNFLLRFIDTRFEKKVVELPLNRELELPAFDSIRASVNLVIASVIISIGTAHKLPLSTTYVTFMVAMGTSLSDRAWGLESAVYRVAGVFNVIGGWFVTAFVAFISAGIMVYLMSLGGFAMVGILFLLALGLILRNYYNFFNHYKKKKANEMKERIGSRNIKVVVDESSDHISEIVKRVHKLYKNVCTDLSNHDLNKLKNNKKHVEILDEEIEDLKKGVFHYIKSLEDDSVDASKFYILILKYIQDISQSIGYISTSSFEHVNNNHRKLKKSQIEDLNKIQIELSNILIQIEEIFQNKTFEKLELLIQEKEQLFEYIESLINIQVNRIRTEESSPKNSTLYFGILLESKDLVEAVLKMLELFRKFRVEKLKK
jgi:phosphate/sulfate permease